MKYNLIIIAALLACGICIASASAVPVIVGYKDASQIRTSSLGTFTIMSGVGAAQITVPESGHVLSNINAVAADLSEQEIAALKSSGAVKYVEPDYAVTALGGPTIPWNIKQIRADTVQAAHNTGSGVKVALIDTGIDYTHPDLIGVYAGGYNVRAGTTDPMDDNGHGTHCSGILAATGSAKGIYGTAPGVSLYGVKVLSSTGDGRVSDVVDGIAWAKNNHMKVASMSLGLGEDSQALHDAIDQATKSGMLIVAAAGNSGVPSGAGDTMSYPAKYDGVLAVAAVNKYNHRAFWSSTGGQLGVSAPGVNVKSSIPGAQYATYSGTSMATPHVAGVAALVFSAHPSWTNTQVRMQIVNTSTPLGTSWFYGAGLVNASAAVGDAAMAPQVTSVATADVQGIETDGLPFSWANGAAAA